MGTVTTSRLNFRIFDLNNPKELALRIQLSKLFHTFTTVGEMNIMAFKGLPVFLSLASDEIFYIMGR